MSDVTDLKAEVLLLRKENKELRADQAHWELGNCPSCPNVVSLQEALEQNAKLRELVVTLMACVSVDDCNKCPINGAEFKVSKVRCCREAKQRMQELGIEVYG